MNCWRCQSAVPERGAQFCARCGAPVAAAPPVPPLPPAPAPAAGWGTPPPVPAGPPAYAPAPPPVYEPRTDYLSSPPPAGWPPPAQPAPPSERPRRVSRRALLVSVGTVLVVAAGAVTAVVLTSGSAATGGAGSPQAAVTGAVQAALRQDIDGVLAMVDPAEARTLGALLSSARTKVSAGGVVSASGVPVPWLKASATGLTAKVVAQYRTVAFVTLTGGRIDATTDENAMPANIRPDHPRVEHKSTTIHGQQLSDKYGAVDTSTSVAVVKVNGRWYLSPTTTMLESIRREDRLPVPDFDHPAALGPGAGTPGGVYEGLAKAIATHDLLAAAGFVSQSELPEIAAYYPVFFSQLSTNLQQASYSASHISTSTQSMSNGLVRVQLDSATLSGPQGEVTYSGGCIDGSAVGRRQCEPSDFTALTGWKYPFVVVARDNGGWRIQPIATVMEYLREFEANGSPDLLYRRLGFFRGVPATATLRVGAGQRVQLNDGGFANVLVKAPAGSCLSGDSTDGGVIQWYGEEDDSQDPVCYRVPAGGQVEATVLNPRGTGRGTLTVDIDSR